MEEPTKWLTTAGLVTAIDAAAATYYGGVVWKVLSGIIWSKILLLLLAAVWATTLLHVWVHACSLLRKANQGHLVVASIPGKALSVEFAEEIDV